MNTFSKCAVCTECEHLDDNLLLLCKSCDIAVHMLCYGSDTKKNNSWSSEWKCSPCKSECLDPICELCSQRDGALKKTTCGNWVHVICALFTDGVIFKNKSKMEPVDISRIPTVNRKQTCILCNKNCGFCCSCWEKNCPNWMHVTCAQKFGQLREATNDKNNMIEFRAYCSMHKLPQSSRRISSISVQSQISFVSDGGNITNASECTTSVIKDIDDVENAEDNDDVENIIHQDEQIISQRTVF